MAISAKGFCCKTVLPLLVAVGASVAITSAVMSQTGTKPDAKQPAAQPGGQMPDMEAMMKEFMEKSQPGPHHKHLSQWAGEWELTLKCRMDASSPWDEWKATSSAKMAMGGKYLIEHVNGEMDMDKDGPMPPMPFEGMSILGWDNFQDKGFSIWCDSMSSGYYLEEGTFDSSGKTLTTTGENFCCMSHEIKPTKSVFTVIDSNTRKLEMWNTGPDGKLFQCMEITYNRKK